MAREYYFYSFSAPVWRAHIGSKRQETKAAIEAALAEHESDPSRAAQPPFYTQLRARAVALVDGDIAVTPTDRDEDPGDEFLAEILLSVGQRPSPGDVGRAFAYALSQITAVGAMIEGQALSRTDLGRAVAKHLADGRGLNGGKPSRYSAYGWLEGPAETSALAELVASHAWAEYTRAGRYNPKRVPVFEKEREAALAWVEDCARSGKDIYFQSHPLRGDESDVTRTSKKRAPSSKKKSS
jgi:hypothetical protein